MKREEAGGETAVISSIHTSHLPTTPLPALQTQLSPSFLPCPGAKISFSWAAGWPGICRQSCWREPCRGDNAAWFFLLQLEWQFLGAKKESESEVLLHIQLLHLLIK